MSEPIFELKNIHYSFLGKFPALCGINLDIKQGDKIAIIGANGTGKSTLMQILDGLIYPDKGEVRAFSRILNEKTFLDEEFSRSFRMRVGLVFQNSDIQLFCPTVKEDILFAPLQLDLPGEVIKKRFEEMVEIFQIGALLERSPTQLSMGEKRKVCLAGSLITDPDVILMDEPTAGLDPQTIRHIVDILIRAHEEGKTVITATHDMHIVEEIADNICVFNSFKKIAKFGPKDEILSDQELLRENNLIHTHIHKHKDKVHIHDHEHLEHHI